MSKPPSLVTTDLFERPGLGSFLADYRQAFADAVKARDDKGLEWLNFYWLDYFQNQLKETAPVMLKKYLESRPVWHFAVEGGVRRPVYKVGEEPCLVFTADEFPDGGIELIALGACYRFPGGSGAAWWTNALEARAKAI